MPSATGPDFQKTRLGSTGLTVGRLGLAASYGVPAAAVEKAFEHGVNYLFWGSLRREEFARALRNLRSRRERLVLVVQSYSPLAALARWSLEKALRRLRYDYTDIFLLGLWNRPVPERLLDACRQWKQRGLLRFLAVSTHNRAMVRRHAASVDVVHFRYNAVHTGAERDIFPYFPRMEPRPEPPAELHPEPGSETVTRPGLVCFTATSHRQLLGHKRIPACEKVPSAVDCYRFVLTRPEVDVCLTGPATAQQMEESLEALRLGPMSATELAWMRRVGSAIYGKPRTEENP